MHEYDTVLKSLLADSPNSLFRLITGAKRGRWLNVELPKVTQARVDLLFELAVNRELILLELQSHNDPDLPVRMAEYVRRILQRIARMKGSSRKMAHPPPGAPTERILCYRFVASKIKGMDDAALCALNIDTSLRRPVETQSLA